MVDVGRCFVKSKGQVQWIQGMFFLLFLVLLVWMQLQLELYRSAASYLEDALAASNLASAVIDFQEYGISHTIQVKNPVEAYGRYCEAVKENLQLEDNWYNLSGGIIAGKVMVINYTIYNVKDNVVTVYCVGTDGSVYEEQGILGSVRAPNGILIEATGIYSEIAFQVKGMFGLIMEAHKGKLVDIVPMS